VHHAATDDEEDEKEEDEEVDRLGAGQFLGWHDRQTDGEKRRRACIVRGASRKSASDSLDSELEVRKRECVCVCVFD